MCLFSALIWWRVSMFWYERKSWTFFAETKTQKKAMSKDEVTEGGAVGRDQERGGGRGRVTL